VEPWATPGDLEARWRPLTDAERARVSMLIEDAQSLVMDECPNWQTTSSGTRIRVICAIVKRAMAAPFADDGLTGISAATETTGPFSQQLTFANPSGDLYLTKAERRAFGAGRGRALEIDLLASREDS